MNIPTSLIVVLLVVAWLVVLVPMIARRRERVPQSEPAGSGFRVLRRASASLRRRPRRVAKASTLADDDRIDTSGPGAGDEELVTVGADHQPADAAEEWAAMQAVADARTARIPVVRPGSDALEQGDDELDGDSVPFARDAEVDHNDVDQADEGDEDRADDEPAIGRADRGRRSRTQSVPDEVDEKEWADHAAAAPGVGGSDHVDDVQLRPVPRRPGRGGFDPEAAEATRAYRYQQRRRITLILLVATVAFAVVALLLASWLWVGAAVSLTLLVGYLAYLRRQVRIEAAIRQKRMARLQRARQIRPEYARPARRPRSGLSAAAPGRTVVDLDDDDPRFDDLEEYHQPMSYRRASGE